MADELSISREGQIAEALEKQGLGEMLQPLIREIHLFDTFVAGTMHLEDASVLTEIKEGDKLILIRVENKFDSRSILIRTESGRKLGYVPEKDNLIFSRLMDAGKLLAAKVKNVRQQGSFTQIGIGIYLMDF